MIKVRIIKYLILLVLVSVLCGFFVRCGLLNKEEAVARIGDAKLTRAELELMVPQIGTEEEYLNAQRKFVSVWVDRELLYQEALQQNLKPTPFMEAELKRVLKSMLVEHFLKSQIDSIIFISDNEIKDYYDDHVQEFVAETNFYKFAGIKTSDAVFAIQLEKELNNGSDLSIIQGSAPDRCRIVSNGMDFLSEILLNPTIVAELQKQKNTKNFNKYSFDGEIYFLKVIDILPQGDVKHFDMVAQETKQMLLHNKRQERYNDLISRLRKNYTYEINLNIPTDSVAYR